SRALVAYGQIGGGVREQVWPLVAAGMVRPVVDRRLPMAEAAEAHRLVESNAHVGKVLLTVQ
ncbi:zinc-binding dehydrogenase, partial [Micromonospora sp. DH15]|nr:zinc-binding dehydrogenase [Micromonospora sp. DH15]